VHRLDRISAKKPAKLLDSKSLTLGFSRKRIWPVFLPITDIPTPRYRPHDSHYLVAVGSRNRYEVLA
jgi:hypothetical protein